MHNTTGEVMHGAKIIMFVSDWFTFKPTGLFYRVLKNNTLNFEP